MSTTLERIKNVKYYVVGGQAFEGSLNENDIRRLTDCDLLLANAANLYTAVDANGYVLTDVLSFLASEHIADIVPEDILRRLVAALELTLTVLATVVQREHDVAAIMAAIVPVKLTEKEIDELSQQHVIVCNENNCDVTNVVPFRSTVRCID